MFIVNKTKITTVAPVVATDDADAVTGNQSARYGGANPNAATGATGNVAAGVGLTNITSIATYDGQVVTSIHGIRIAQTLTAGQVNVIRIPLSSLGISGNKVALGIRIIGIYNPNATENNNTPTPSLIAGVGRAFVVKDAAFLEIQAANIALYQGKIANLEIIYFNPNS